VRDASRGDPREHGGGIDFLLELKDYWPMALRFRPVWHLYTSGSYKQNIHGIGLTLPRGDKLKYKWMDMHFHGVGVRINGHSGVHREIVKEGGSCYERDLIVRWTLREKPHQLEKAYLPMSYAGSVMDFFELIRKDHRRRTGYHFEYSSNHVRGNTRFLRNLMGVFFPRMSITDWTLVTHGTPGAHYEQYEGETCDDFLCYLFAMGTQRRTITPMKILKAIVAVVKYFKAFIDGDVRAIVQNYIDAIDHVAQQQAAGSNLIPSLKKVLVIKPRLHRGESI